MTQEARRFILPYLQEIHVGPRLQRPLDETASMCAQLFPEAAYKEVLLTSIFVGLQFICDDMFDGYDVLAELRAIPAAQRVVDVLLAIRERPRLLASGMTSIIEVLRNPGHQPAFSAGSAERAVFLLDAFAEFGRRLGDYGSGCQSPHYQAWLGNFCDSLTRFSYSHGQIYRDIEVVSIEEYSAHKLTNCGMHHTILLMELATRSILSPAQRQHPLVAALEGHCRHIGSLLNEVISYEKEALRESTGNLVSVIMNKRGCDLRTAAAEVLRRANDHAAHLARACAQALAEFSGSNDEHALLRRWVRGIDFLAAGCWHWQITGTTRYRSSTSPFTELCAANDVTVAARHDRAAEPRVPPARDLGR